MQPIFIKMMGLGAVGLSGSWLAGLLGGWNVWLDLLVWAMTIDYISGLAVATVFKKSTKTNDGGLESLASWKGLIRKGMTLAIVLICAKLDHLNALSFSSDTFIRDSACIAFIISECISIRENAIQMGLRTLGPIEKIIDLLKNLTAGGK